MSKKQVQLYLVGKKLLASVIVLHNWGTMQSGPMFPFQYRIRMFGKKWSLLFKPELPPAVLVIHFSMLPSSHFYVVCFSNSDPWSFWNEVCSLGAFPVALCIGALSVSLHQCLSPGSLRFSGLLLESWELCPSYTSCIWKQVSSSNTSRSLPGNRDEFTWILWTIPWKSPNQEAGKYFMNQCRFMILTNFFP